MISGGVVAAVIAPVLAIQFQKVKGLPDFTAIYLIFCGLALLLSPILYIWNSKHKLQQTPQPKVESLNRVKCQSIWLLLRLLVEHLHTIL